MPNNNPQGYNQHTRRADAGERKAADRENPQRGTSQPDPQARTAKPLSPRDRDPRH